MEVQSETPRSRLEGLPPELVRAVLHELSDLTSLRCAILSSRILWNSFMADPQGIATRALINELNMCCVLPEAMAALRASELIKPTRSSVQKFCETYVQSRNSESPVRLTLDQVTRLSRLHATVSRMAKSFAAAALQDLASTIEEYDDLETLSEVPEPSEPEKHRIMRTLYILEAFFGLFDKTAISRTEIRSAMHDFLLNFAHWEVEQMACMQEFLFAQVSRGYNEMAAHDVCWGRLQVPPALWYGNGGVQNLYFRGLVALEKLAAATTYDELYDRYGDGKTLASRSYHLYGALEEFTRGGAGGDEEGTKVSEYQDVQDYALKVRRPHFEDPDGGPFAIWKWANGPALVSRSVYQAERWKLRKWGYVVWDASRLQTLAACYDAWQPPRRDRFPLPPPPPTYPPEDLDDSWEHSWVERAWIYDKGGRGWWAAGDESRVVWTKKENDGDRDGWGRKSKVSKTSHVVPTSLEEARRAILSLQRP